MHTAPYFARRVRDFFRPTSSKIPGDVKACDPAAEIPEHLLDPVYRHQAYTAAQALWKRCHEAIENGDTDDMPPWPERNKLTVDGVITTLLSHARFLVTFNHDYRNEMKMHLTEVPPNTFVFTTEQWVRYIEDSDFPERLLPQVLAAAQKRLERLRLERLEGMRE